MVGEKGSRELGGCRARCVLLWTLLAGGGGGGAEFRMERGGCALPVLPVRTERAGRSLFTVPRFLVMIIMT